MFWSDGIRRAAVAASVLGILLNVAPGASEEETPRGTLTLRQALVLAIEENPRLAGFSWEIRAAESRALQAGLRPNPTFSLDVENVAGSGEFDGFVFAETTLVLAQLVELGGKRRKRQALGAREVEVAEREFEAARLEVLIATTDAFYAALAAQENVRLIDVQLDRARELLEAIEARGRSSAQLLRSDVEVTIEEIDRRRSFRELHVARVRLATLWGAMHPDFGDLEGDFYAVSPVPEERDVVKRLVMNPELLRWRAEIAQRRAEITLEDARRIPDLEIGLGPRHINDGATGAGDWVLVAGIQLPIPVFDRNQGARREARDELARARELQLSARLGLRREVAAVHSGLISSYEEVTALRDDAIPTARSAYEAMLAGGRRGAVSLTGVLDTQRSLFDVETRLLEALTSYHQLRAELEALIGGSLDAGRRSKP